jgi:hypothetical protein
MSAKTLGQISCTLWLYLVICITPSRAQVSGGLPPLAAQPSQTQVQVTPPNPTAIPIPDERVQAIQEALNRKGFNAGVADGYMGPQTQGAIAAAERASGLPITGLPSPALLAVLKNEKETLLSAEESLLNDHRTLGWAERVAKYRKEIGKSIPIVNATLSGELSNPIIKFPQLASRIEKSQTGWRVVGDVNHHMVFYNSTGKSLDGLVVKITDRGCNSGEKSTYRIIKFVSEVKPDRLVDAFHSWDPKLPSDWLCLDVVDVIFK